MKMKKNIGGILVNLKTLTDKLSDLQRKVDIALAGVPNLTVNAQKSLTHFNALSTDAQLTLKHIDSLTGDLQALTKEVKTLSIKAAGFADTGKSAGDLAMQTTLPKINQMLTELQSTTSQLNASQRCWKIIRNHCCWALTRRMQGPANPVLRKSDEIINRHINNPVFECGLQHDAQATCPA